MEHAKRMLFDDDLTFIGSYNFDPFRHQMNSETIVASLEAGTLDLGFLALVPELAGLDHAEICEDRFVVALPKDHPLVKRKVLRQSDLEGESVLLLDDGHCFRTQALAVCDVAGAGRAELAPLSACRWKTQTLLYRMYRIC